MTQTIDNSLFFSNCPLCNSNRIEKVYTLNYSANLYYSTTQIQLKNTPELWCCHQCESSFTQNCVNESDSYQLYAQSQSGERWKTAPFEKEKTKDVVKFFLKQVKSGTTVLDIGANTGEFLDFAKKHGAETIAVEYSEQSRTFLEAKAHKAFKSITELDSKVDIITAFDLVEHVYNLPQFIDDCLDKLKPNGKLIIFTGDISSWGYKKAKANWWYINFPEHIVFPSKKFVSELKGFRLLEKRNCYNSQYFLGLNFSMAAILNYPKAFGLRKGKAPYTGLPSLLTDHIIWVLEKI
ncbi:MAG: class I SAM-dependent methyltransferase [Candidatus Methylacidiphilales bacterium]